MSGNPLSEERQLVPRWRSFQRSSYGHDLRSLRRPLDRPLADLGILRREAEQSNNEWVLADFLGALVSNGIDDDERIDVATRLFNGAHDVVLRDWASGLMVRPAIAARNDPIRLADAKQRALIGVPRLRRRLVERPRDVVARVDLALAHIVLGNREQARRQMFGALQLGAGNRFVVRGAATLFETLDEPDLGYWALTSTDLHYRDPWVMASALALADLSDRKADIRSARELLTLGKFGPADTSELSSELGTLEGLSGKRSRARQLFVASLLAPNDNTLAQAAWASDELSLDLELQDAPIDGAHEAQLRGLVKDGAWSLAYHAGVLWQGDQSFSQAAALATSFVAAVGLEDFEAALRAAEIGMRANPGDGGIRNNAAFAAAQLGRLSEAEAHLAAAGMTADEDQAHTVEATRGLIAFRRGDVPTGRRLYGQAREGFMKSRSSYQAVMALLHWAMEEARINPASARVLLAPARESVASHPTAEGSLMLKRLEARLSASP